MGSTSTSLGHDACEDLRLCAAAFLALYTCAVQHVVSLRCRAALMLRPASHMLQRALSVVILVMRTRNTVSVAAVLCTTLNA